MTSKNDALLEIADIARRHGLTTQDIISALSSPAQMDGEKSSGTINRLFSYIGGILIFAGICVFGAMIWDDVGLAGHVMMTLGIGFCTFIMGITCARDARLEKASTPLFLVAALFQPAGIFIILDAYSKGGDPLHAVIFMSLVMLLQQGFTFAALRRTALAFFSIVFGIIFFGAVFELMEISDRLSGLVIGSSLMFIAWSLDSSPHKSIAPMNYFLGSGLVLCIAADLLQSKPYEILFLGLSCGFIFLSTLTRSRMLLTTSTLATLGYIGYFSEKHFGDTLGWPLLMMVMGFVLIGIGMLAVRINNRYIRQG